MYQTPILKERGSVRFGRNQRRKINCMCTISNSSSHSIKNVWLVNALKHNLLSISQLCDSDYEVVFDNNNCIVINPSD